ncbi:RelA/SpoT domain-containing protein [Streptomyces sp. ISL-90]|nr:RelA/SpoT domain-containing protein [Streptomyces sp. ISL-90]
MTAWTPEALYEAYRAEEANYAEAARTYKTTLRRLLERGGVIDCSVKARAKSAVELYKKQRRKRYEDPWSECPDLVGARIVVPTPGTMSAVVATLKASEEFSTFEIEDQREEAKPNEIRYLGLHVHLGATGVANSRGEPIQCELQVRTIAQDAWSVTDHRYVYKKPIDISDELRRVFNRLLVLTELFDSELQRGVEAVSKLATFRCFELSRYLEATLTTLGPPPGDFESTFETTQQLVEANLGSPEELRELVVDYMEAHIDDVEHVLGEIGPDSPAFDISNHWLTTQGEILVLMALLDKDEYTLGNKLAGSDLYERLAPVAATMDKTGYLAVS